MIQKTCSRFCMLHASALLVWTAAQLMFSASTLLGQSSACPVLAHGEPSAADAAYQAGRYSQAEDLYGQELAKHPQDLALAAAMIKTWLHEGEVKQAAAQVNRISGDNPHSAIVLTALAEVQIHQGQPWLALDTLKEAEKADACYARVHFVRSRALRLDSMYASERAEVQAAYEIDPEDPDIRHAWLSVVSAAHEIEGIDASLKTMKNLDEATQTKARDSIRSMMPLLSENNQTCEVLPAVESASFALQPAYYDAKHVDGYRLDVQFPKTKVSLRVDTAASGMFISRAVAEANGLEGVAGAPPGTVHVDKVQIGPLEFRDCTVGVSETPFAGKNDGYISTDMFASYLITLDHGAGKLTLNPLPSLAGVLPGDRTVPPELRDYTPVYHRKQYLMVPVDLNNKTRQLFVLDSGIRLSTMTSNVAHSISATKVNFTNPIQTVSGATLQVYRDSFDFQFANQSLEHQGHILEFDPSNISRTAGVEVAGMLGFDMLHTLTMHLDYRDGLVKFESAETGTSGHGRGNHGADVVECPSNDSGDRPLNSVIQAKVTGLIESTHLKPGKAVTVTVVNRWEDPECSLSAGAILYGHVTESSSSQSPESSTLGLMFDHGDCDGHEKKPLSLRLIGVVASPDSFVGLQSVVPSEVAGGARSISVVESTMGSFALDVNLNPDGPPHTIHPGIAAGLPKLKLEPLGGASCSARFTTTEHSVKLGAGAQLLLTRQSLTTAQGSE